MGSINKTLLYIFIFCLPFQLYTQTFFDKNVLPGAYNISTYLPLLKGKKVGVYANHTSMIDGDHLVDFLKKSGVNITLIFGPEHGFRGTADAGEKVGNEVDQKTGIPIISLYGSKHAPGNEDLDKIDIIIFDIQDLGVRFYTYISSLEELMNATFKRSVPLIILDRPNPNGHYIDGPVLEKSFRSFVGMQQIPVVYGMTIGEYALMLAGEGWLQNDANLSYKNSLDKKGRSNLLTIIPCKNYTHHSKYKLPISPSPNIPDMTSVYLYPSICFFEGTYLSEGRGTAKPFQIFGHPSLPSNLYSFTPVSTPGAKEPKWKNQLCYGWSLISSPDETYKMLNGKIHLKYILEAYKIFPDKNKFFIPAKSGKKEDCFFNKLTGNAVLQDQIIQGMDESSIRKSWDEGLTQFKQIRKKYLLYKD
ncbi:MAG: exo-beta-N-acetylmuramidase NamZ family protein [Chitinophagaceae bacterium]